MREDPWKCWKCWKCWKLPKTIYNVPLSEENIEECPDEERNTVIVRE